VQGDGKVLLAGDVRWFEDRKPAGIVRLNADGTLDGSFNPKFEFRGGFNGFGSLVTLQPDGRILVAGLFDTITDQSLPDGATQCGWFFGPEFQRRFGHRFPGLRCQDTIRRKLLVAGSFAGVQGVIRYGIARLNVNGTVDTSFNSSLLPYPQPAEDRRDITFGVSSAAGRQDTRRIFGLPV